MERWNAVLVALLVMASFASGSMYTKIQYLEKNTVVAKPQILPVLSPTPSPAATSLKTDRPQVELFVISYCPYGLQVQKALVPVAKLLKGKADITVRWVDYAMHGEKEILENINQYCLQQTQPEKYWPYLECFVANNDSQNCQQTAGVDTLTLRSCFEKTDGQYGLTKSFRDSGTWLNGQFPPFGIDTSKNKKYQVRGSPTIIINGQVASPPTRSAESVKQLICSSFINLPAECNQTLSTSEERPGPCEVGLPYVGGGQGGCQ